MQDIADAHDKAKQDLQQQLDQAKQAGDQKAAQKLQQQLDQLQAQNEQMDRMKQMAKQMGEAANQMKQGNMQQAADKLNDLANDLQDLQGQLDELEMLDEAMDQMMAARESMCKACKGGKNGMQGMMPGMGQMGQKQGNGLGPGQGQGERPEAEDDTGFYDSQVRADPKKGKGVVVDFVKGKNMAGQTLIEIKETMQAEGKIEDSALSEKRLSKDHQKNAQQYFDLIREGN